MKNLTKVISLAPSELPRSELILKIRAEHQRVSEGVEAYTAQTKRGTSSKKARTLSPTKFLQTLKEAGLTLEQYQELQEFKRKAENGNTT